MTPRLITTPASHYCEKARWALDRAGYAYVEERHAPLVGRLATARAGARTGTVPVLVCDEGVFGDSTQILRWVDRRMPLFPPGAAELEDRLDEGLGRAARTVVFHHVSADRALAMRLSTAGVPRWERAVVAPFFPFARRWLARTYGVDPARAERARDEIRRAFAEIGELLADGRRYLCGDAFSAADLTFAALANLVILARGGASALDVSEVAPELAALVRELRATAAGAFVLRLFAEERWSAASRGAIVP
jgi:glutathione S-transferase